MKQLIMIALKFLLSMIILTGIIYPLMMTGVAQVIFPEKANGSLIVKDGKLIGSRLIGQKFDSIIYFSSRPSAIDYNPVPSSGSNLGPTSDKLKMQLTERRKEFATLNSVKDSTKIPVEMLFASGSGLDPHISPEAALIQLNRVVASRNYNDIQKKKILEIIQNLVENPQFSLLGDPRINVFELNLAMDKMDNKYK
jgi:potassium-transporting ATPase KdpC subunit